MSDLKITEFAKLAHTTCRTLQFYDEIDLFKPAYTTENGYRYYLLEQLYDFSFISALRELGMRIDDIKSLLLSDDPTEVDSQLHSLEKEIDEQMENLRYNREIVLARLAKTRHHALPALDTIYLDDCPVQTFWCSQKECECTPEEMSRSFSVFYSEIRHATLLNQQPSGFLTDLTVNDAQDYMAESFRFIKAWSGESTILVPKIDKPGGQYLSIRVINTEDAIISGLEKLKEYSHTHNLSLSDKLWQLNVEERLTHYGASETGILQYAILPS